MPPLFSLVLSKSGSEELLLSLDLLAKSSIFASELDESEFDVPDDTNKPRTSVQCLCKSASWGPPFSLCHLDRRAPLIESRSDLNNVSTKVQ